VAVLSSSLILVIFINLQTFIHDHLTHNAIEFKGKNFFINEGNIEVKSSMRCKSLKCQSLDRGTADDYESY